MKTNAQNMIRRLADYERISGILWIVIAVVQICTIVGAIAGIWNIFAGRSRLKISKRIAECDRNIPKEFEPTSQLLVIGIVNFLLGGVVGILLVVFDFYIRDIVLTNAHLFTGEVLKYASNDADNVDATPTDFDRHLRQLQKLKDDGIITEEDFSLKKKSILQL